MLILFFSLPESTEPTCVGGRSGKENLFITVWHCVFRTKPSEAKLQNLLEYFCFHI